MAIGSKSLFCAALVAVTVLSAPAFARSLVVETPTVKAAVSAAGGYSVRDLRTGWDLQGSLGERPRSLVRRSGTDALGPWRELIARTRAQAAVIRVYSSRPLVLFRDERITAGRNTGVFPAFRALPAGLTRFSYGVNTFARYEFGALGAQGPWVLFDARGRTLVLSPADHFLAADMTDGPGLVDAGGIDPKITRLPAGFEHATLLAFGRGIGATLDAWGRALQALNGKQPVSNRGNVLLAKLGYWTDHGGTYYYRFVPKLGYAGTLRAVRAAYRKLGVPVAYMELDSWWYPKQMGNSLAAMAVNGETVYRADRKIFPQGLRAFDRQLGLPLAVHARWVAPDSPYRHEYRMSRNVVLSRTFWRRTARYLRAGGVVAYEQDWLSKKARPAINLTDPGEFLGNMAHAMAREGIAILYCMPLPADFLASTRYSNVVSIRVSNDEFKRARWDDFLYTSALAHAVGLWPWSDVFMSRQLPELILSTLSGGPVGVGDALGRIDAANLRRAMGPHSVLLKPDVPIQPVDATFLAEARNSNAPMVAATHSGDELEVFAYPRVRRQKRVTVSLRELGLTGPAYAWNWRRRRGRRIPAGGSFPMRFRNGWAYDIVTPIHPGGIALLGEIGKIVPLSRERFAVVSRSSSARVRVHFAGDERAVTITGYASGRPSVHALIGRAGAVRYNATTRLFTTTAYPVTTPGEARSAELMITAGQPRS